VAFSTRQAAHELGISEVTLQNPIAKIMHKMDAQSLAGIVRMGRNVSDPAGSGSAADL